jgi:hypothetical protein
MFSPCGIPRRGQCNIDLRRRADVPEGARTAVGGGVLLIYAELVDTCSVGDVPSIISDCVLARERGKNGGIS